MLTIKPNCEHCDMDLPADSVDARICSYECTFCKACVETVLCNVCPNCGGGFCQRPIRPKLDRREGIGLEHQVASNERVLCKYSEAEIRQFAEKIAAIAPADR